jgi:hypothetical protein
MLGTRFFAAIQKLTSDDIDVRFESVHSKSITEIGYDAEKQAFFVIYNNGLVYSASEFPQEDYQKLLSEDFDHAYSRIVLANFPLEKVASRAPLHR